MGGGGSKPEPQPKKVIVNQDAEENKQEAEEEEEEDHYEKFKVKQKKAAALKNKDVSSKGPYDQFEALIPLQLLDIREYEGRLKKLVYNKDTISVAQLRFSFTRDYEDFEGLNDEANWLYQVMTAPEFKKSEGDEEISIQYLLLIGLLYCKGSNEEKSRVFYDILQDGLQDTIAANDKDIKACFGRLFEMASCNVHRWSTQLLPNKPSGGNPDLEKNAKNAKKWKEALNEIQDEFLDKIFDVESKIEREVFIKKVANEQSYIFKPSDLRAKVLAKFADMD